ncbi:MAG: type II toxin-antitoxin system VapC family toxin [Chloroflexi bacterium]|nr:type II toxin-antitoxin system VapC family toxin [Chloroflexota bacterium]
MTAYFFDTSALIKRYVVEAGTDWVLEVVGSDSGNTIFIAQITPVELASGLARLKREGILTAQLASSARILYDRHVRREYDVVGLTRRVVQRAQDLLDVHSLRAYDAVQLASALESNARLLAANLSPLVFVSADVRLLHAASTEGLQTHQPA